MPSALILFSPWADLELKNQSCASNAKAEVLSRVDALRQWAEWYTQGTDRADPLASPVNADFQGLPPMLVQAGSDEILPDDARAVAHSATTAGIAATLREWEGLWHCWQIPGALIPENTATFAEMRGFLAPLLPTVRRS